MKPGKLTYSLKEAAEATGLSYWTIRREVRAGKFKCSTRASRILIFAESLKQWLEDGVPEFIRGK